MDIGKNTIVLDLNDLKELLSKALYNSQGISDVNNILFIVSRRFDSQLSDYVYECDGATVIFGQST